MNKPTRTKVVFPFRLYDILSQPENEDVISWQPHGKSFKVHNMAKFTELILPSISCSRQIKGKPKFSSFLRNLNLYGFTRLYQGLDKGCYYHQLFVRGERNLCEQMHRKKINGNKVRVKPPSIEPNFHEEDIGVVGEQEEEKEEKEESTNSATSVKPPSIEPNFHEEDDIIGVLREQEEEKEESTNSAAITTTSRAGFSSHVTTNKRHKKKHDNTSSSSTFTGFSSKTTNKRRNKKKDDIFSPSSLSTEVVEKSNTHQQDDQRDDQDWSYRRENISNAITSFKTSILLQQNDLTSCMIEQREGMMNGCDDDKREIDHQEDHVMTGQHLITNNDTISTIPLHHETQEHKIFLSNETLKRYFEPDDVKSLLNALF